MHQIISQRKFKFLLWATIGVISLLTTMVILVYLVLKLNIPSLYLLNIVLWGVIAVMVLIYTARFLYIPMVTIDNHRIEIKYFKSKVSIPWENIEEVDFKSQFNDNLMQAIKVYIKDRKKPYIIYSNHYVNAGLLLQYINYGFETRDKISLQNYIPYEDSNRNYIFNNESVNFIKRVSLLSFKTPIFLIALSLIISAFAIKSDISGRAVLLLFGVLTLLICTISVNKIGVTKDYLIIKNIYLGLTRVFNLLDINEVILECYKGHDGLKIFLKNGKYKWIQALNFKKEEWLELEKQLKARNVTVENTLYPKANENTNYIKYY